MVHCNSTKDKHIICNSGIGFESAVLFAKEGAYVVCADLNEKGLSATLEKIEKVAGPNKAIAVPTDVSKEEQVKRLVDTAVEKFGTCYADLSSWMEN